MDAKFFATGLGAPEGPVTLEDGSMYVTEMSAAPLQVTRLFQDGRRKVIKRTGGRPNGLAVDGEGNLWIAEAGLRAVICIDVEGRELMRIDHDGEQPFRLPNDLCFGKDGHLYLTHSGLSARDFLDGQNFAKDYRKLPWDGRVYEIDPIKGAVLRILDRGILFTNGIAFGPGDALYANASFTGEVYRYDVFGGVSPKREIFGNVLQPFKGDDFRGPDGMAWGGATTAGFTARSTGSRT
jgi:gluconolactonase